MWGVILIIILLILDWANAGDPETEEGMIYLRFIMTFVAVLLLDGGFITAIVLAAIWTFVGGVIFSIIGDGRAPASTTTKATATTAAKSTTAQVPQVREYLLNGQGTVTNTLFIPGKYPGYKEISRDSQGRTLANSNGQIICTRYIRK